MSEDVLISLQASQRLEVHMSIDKVLTRVQVDNSACKLLSHSSSEGPHQQSVCTHLADKPSVSESSKATSDHVGLFQA